MIENTPWVLGFSFCGSFSGVLSRELTFTLNPYPFCSSILFILLTSSENLTVLFLAATQRASSFTFMSQGIFFSPSGSKTLLNLSSTKLIALTAAKISCASMSSLPFCIAIYLAAKKIFLIYQPFLALLFFS